jgi:hypothetical protein
MKPLLLALIAVTLLALTACPKQPGGTASSATAAKPASPQAPQVAAPSAQPAAPAPPPPGAPKGQLALDGLYIGMDVAKALAQIPSQWEGQPQWAPNAKDRTGYITATAPSKPPQKGVMTPPEVRSYFFLEGKLVAALQAAPGTSQADYDRWVAANNANYGPSSDALPEYAKNCEFLDRLKYPPPDSKSVVWDDAGLQQVLALQYTPAMGMATYMLADALNYAKVTQAIMSQPGNSAPPAPPPGG